MEIEEQLYQHLKDFKTAPFLFVGSGLSRRYLNLETWGELLKKYSALTKKDYQYYYSRSDGNYPKIASSIAEEFYEIWWKGRAFRKNRKEYKDDCINTESPMKIEISEYIFNIKSQLTKDSNLLSEIDLLKSATIDGVITTNWDQFLENIFKDFKCFIGQEQLLFSNSFGIGEIYKIHGCCSIPNSLILTEKDYLKFNQRNPYLAAKLMTIFTEHPIIFIGYSISDENIISIIKSIANCLTNENIERLRDRLIFVKWGDKKSYEKSSFVVENDRIPMIIIETNEFHEIFSALNRIKRKFPARMLRHLKEQIYSLVKGKNDKKSMYVADIEGDDNIDKLEVVFGVGAISKIKGTGYKAIDRNDLFFDTIFDGDKYESDRLLKSTIPVILRGAKNVPIFKYLKESGYINDKYEYQNLDQLDPKIQKLLNDIKGLEYYFPSGHYATKKSAIRKLNLGVSEYLAKYSHLELLKYNALLSPSKLKSAEFQDFLQTYYETYIYVDNSTIRSQFQKMICLYDYLKYKEGK